MLQTLGQSIVRTLGRHTAIHQVQLRAGLCLDWAHGVRDQPLSRSDFLEELEPRRTRCTVLDGSLMSLLRDHVHIGRSAEEGKSGVRTGLTDALHNRITGQRELHMQCTVQIGVVSDGQTLALADSAQPVADFRGVREQVATRNLGEFFIVEFTLGLIGTHWENETTRRSASLLDKTSPDMGKVQINSNNVGTMLEQKLVGTHGRRSTKQNKVAIREIQPIRMSSD
mmetsp:Transcript_11524/g.29050  ORF Transcript_11524/g.29050 Transcript_11524/m.29050 type:complete len:226 (+) Transcript_11524:501-1178(+)